jgi:hypothetical protein
MDPRFTPAQQLREKARNKDSDVDISELQAFANPPAPGTPAAAPTPGPSAPAAAEPPAAKPDLTLALGYPKLGHFTFPGAGAVGRLRVLEIGLPAGLGDTAALDLLSNIRSYARDIVGVVP